VFQLAAGLLMTGDVIFVKHYFPKDQYFAFAATLGRTVAFMALAVATAMFPKVVSEGTFTQKHRRLYLRSQLYTSAFIGISLVFCLLIPRLLLKILFDLSDPSENILLLTRLMGVAMAFTTLLNINISLLLAQRRFVLLLSVLGSAIFYGVGVWFYHETTLQIVLISIFTNLVAFVVTTWGILRPQKDRVL
jgi:hypothetical protein